MESFYRRNANNELDIHLHAGQARAFESKKRFVVVLAGTQSGKTSFGPFWLHREILERGAGDYMVVAPTYKILSKKALPEFKRLFEDMLQLGTYKTQKAVFEFSEDGCRRTFGDDWANEKIPTNVHFGHAQDPDSLESATAKAAWLDEAGQNKFKLGSWEAILRRLSLSMGRVLITTTPYNLGWLKQKLYDPWKAGTDDTIDVVNFRSIDNPLFPREEFERARRTLPGWKFRMFYLGLFDRPAGLIYDCFKDEFRDGSIHTCPRFNIPKHWKRYVGVDFGGVNTAANFYARDPKSGVYYLYKVYFAGKRTAAEHAEAMLKGEPGLPAIAVGGSKSEGQWRREFRAGGLPLRRPAISSIDVGIDRVYGAHKTDRIMVFDDLDVYLDEKLTYSRVLDDNGEPTEKIADANSFHVMDAERYIMGFLMRPEKKKEKPKPQGPRSGDQRYKRSLRGKL